MKRFIFQPAQYPSRFTEKLVLAQGRIVEINHWGEGQECLFEWWWLLQQAACVLCSTAKG